MLKWIFTLIVALMVLTALAPWLSKYGLGQLPGDITVRYHGRNYRLPFTTTLLLSLALTLLTRIL